MKNKTNLENRTFQITIVTEIKLQIDNSYLYSNKQMLQAPITNFHKTINTKHKSSYNKISLGRVVIKIYKQLTKK